MDKLRVVRGCSVMRFFQVAFKVMLNTGQSIFNLFLAGAYASIVLMVILCVQIQTDSLEVGEYASPS